MVKKQVNIDIPIKRYIEALEEKVKVSKVVLYGSWVNGQPHEYSDIDLAVFSPDFGKNKLLELQLLSKLSWTVDESIEAIPYSVLIYWIIPIPLALSMKYSKNRKNRLRNRFKLIILNLVRSFSLFPFPFSLFSLLFTLFPLPFSLFGGSP